jgi:fatty acid desaturase
MFFFNIGWSEVATPIAVVRDIAIVLTFAKLVLNIGFGWKTDILICVISGLIFVLVGWVLKVTGMSDFATKMGNSVNPELKMINKISEHLGIKE